MGATAANIAQYTNGELRPAYEVIQRQVGHLALGDLVVEPVLGEVRVVHVADFGYDEQGHQQRQLQVHWVTDDGLSTAAQMFPINAVVGACGYQPEQPCSPSGTASTWCTTTGGRSTAGQQD